MNSSSNEKYVYTCGRWLAQDELDQRIEIEIPTDNDNNIKPSAIKQSILNKIITNKKTRLFILIL